MTEASATYKKNSLTEGGCQGDSGLALTSSEGHATEAVGSSNTKLAGRGKVALPFDVQHSDYGLDADGGDGHPSLDNYVISARTPTPDRGGVKNFEPNRRVRRFYQRYFTGVGVGGRLRFLTLTSSDEAVIEGYDIHRHFRALVMRMRRRWGRFEYIGVREVKGDREHLHLVFRGSYMEQAVVSAMWQVVHRSPVVDIKAVYSQRGGARYLAKYLAKEALNRYWASYDWVFRGWVGWSRRVKRAVGHYPSKGLLRSLARLDKVKRRLVMDSLEWRYPTLWDFGTV